MPVGGGGREWGRETEKSGRPFPGGGGCLTILEGGVLYAVSAIPIVGDVRFCLGPRGVDDAHLDVAASRLGQRARINGELGGDLTQDTWGEDGGNEIFHDQLVSVLSNFFRGDMREWKENYFFLKKN